MTLTLLLDLDDTLLNTNVNVFVPAYFQALARELSPRVPPDLMMQGLVSGLRLMSESEDFTRTIKRVFEEHFYPLVNLPDLSLEAEIEKFYDEVFPTLEHLTSKKDDAKPFVNWAQEMGFRIAIATDPILPKKATHHRLKWAGFDPDQFDLVTTFDRCHFSKSHPAYYAETLGMLGWQDGPVLMVGNDWERDILPAKALGLATFFVETEPGLGAEKDAGKFGSLADLQKWLQSKDLSSLLPSYRSGEAIRAILYSTPAVLNDLLMDLGEAVWNEKSFADDWSLTEIICHLRDTEREIHQMQLGLFKSDAEPFIPRPDTSVWASERDYRHENGALALKELNAARIETIEKFEAVSKEDWGRKARHAIFGPTNFLEVAGFIADHDRMHVHQVWSALRAVV